ncbi:MAG: T9SS type A sorting domain-containing protein [Candidatus Cloacimonas sp.]|jgi:hypothetical protein|nr:T9SS type A sorting domain-containing protein [Candidatus Cloacimonas sp.]
MKTLWTFFLIAITALLMAQGSFPYTQINHSSVDQNGNLNLRWHDLSAGTGVTELYYNTSNGAWTSVAPSFYSDQELQAQVPYTFGQRLRYRLRLPMESIEGSTCMMNPAYWDTDSFPPSVNSMAFIGADASGDSVTVYNPNLDLLNSYMATSPQKLYFSQSNLSGSFPTMVSLTSYNIYMGIITNMEAAVDTVAYAMIYSYNIPGVISNGLYKVSYDALTGVPNFVRIGNIQAQVNGGYLHMACNFSDLTADPEFGAWPNDLNGLIMVGATMGVTVSLPSFEPTLGFGDYSFPAMAIFTDNLYQVNANTLPTVNYGSYDSLSSSLTLNYSDAEGDFPLIAEVQTLGGTIIEAIPLSSDYIAGATFVVQIPAEELGLLVWRFSDNGYQFVMGECNPSANEDELLIPLPFSCRMQNPVRNWPVNVAIKGLESQPTQIQVFNLRGQKLGDMFSGKPDQKDLNISWDGKIQGKKLASGVYFLKVNNGTHSFSQRFVVIE